jgi:ubiquinone/menaquinone biosynthesis C-methylase UbiE
MNESFKKIKEKFRKIPTERYWGDDFDVRYHLISKLKELNNRTVLDIGGGVGITLSEMSDSNNKINLDFSQNDLKFAMKNFGASMKCVNASMTNLPFKDNSFDCVICSHILEIAKNLDISSNQVIEKKIDEYPTIVQVLNEIKRILKNDSWFYLTTPNNATYKSTKLTYYELKNSIEKCFKDYSIFFFNTYPKISQKYRKLNFSNSIPKIKLKFKEHSEIINSLVKEDNGKNLNSISFYVEIKN